MKKLVFLLLLPFILFAESSVTMSVDQNVVTLRSIIELTIEFKNFDNFPNLRPDLKNNFTIISGPSKSSSHSWINGVSTSSKSLIYSISPLKEGELTIPGLNFKFKRKNYKTNSIKISVVKSRSSVSRSSNQSAKAELVFMEPMVAKTEAVVGEVIAISYKLFYKTKVVNYSFDAISTLPGFFLENIKQKNNPSVSVEMVNGVKYNTAVLKQILVIPTESGEQTIPPQNVRLEIQRQSQRRSIFDDPFFSSFNTQSKNIVTPAITIKVKKLPGDAPDSFTGAVGEFSFEAHLDTNRIEADQAVNLIVEVKGEGNLKNFTFPKPDFPSQFQVFDPKMTEKISILGSRIQGKKTWEYILIPNSEGRYTFPEINFTYYSPKNSRYVTLNSDRLVLNVSPNIRLIEDVQRGLSPQQVELLNEDIRYIYTNESTVYLTENNPVKDWRIWFIPILALLAIPLHYIFNFIWLRRLNDPSIMRKANAYKKAKKAMALFDEDETVSLSELSHIFQSYLSDKYNLKDGEVQLAIILDRLKDKRKSKTIKDELSHLWSQFEAIKYSPDQVDGSKREDLKNKLMACIEKLEKMK